MRPVASPFVKRLREMFEKIAYAGLQPGAPAAPAKRKWLGPLSGPIERLLSGGPAPTDPLYLTNRTTGQKIKRGLLIGVPCLGLAVLVIGMLTGDIDFSSPRPVTRETNAAEVAAKLLPHMDSSIRIDTDKEVEVLEAHVEHGTPTYLVGRMKNTTNHEIHIAEAVFDLTDSGGSQLGGVSAKIENIAAGSSAGFKVAILQSEAHFALVREIHTQ